MKDYIKILQENGYLVMSGFYENDIKDLDWLSKEFGLKRVLKKTKGDWACLVYEKIAVL